MSSWAIDNSRLDLDFDGPTDYRLANYSESNEWMIVASSASRHIEPFQVENNETLEFTQLIYSMTIRRRVGFYVYALIIPSVLLSLLMPLTFWIPPNGDGRITLCTVYSTPVNVVRCRIMNGRTRPRVNYRLFRSMGAILAQRYPVLTLPVSFSFSESRIPGFFPFRFT